MKQYAEVEIHNCLSKAFSHLKHEVQANVGMYFSDMLFMSQPGLSQPLVIECDERGHRCYDAAKDSERMSYIT